MQRPIIRRLSEHVVDLIAAGEVVERPAAALKELVENAIDAGATKIEISLRNGGSDFIEVHDNGCGMTKEELSLAVERHCTSKLPHEDLVNIKTLGFRGEALPSIGATARLSITSRVEGAETAWCLRVEGGKVSPMTPAPGEVGTRIIVKDLFFAIPARRKFLKSARVESSHAESVVKRLALSAPDCAFSLRLDNRILFAFPAQTLKERVAAILSVAAQSLLEIDVQRGEMRLTGFICGPAHTRSTGSEQYILVNHRPVTDPMLRTALRVAYRPVIEQRRFPILYLHLTLPFKEVDVNVHPAKTELRFARETEVKSLFIGSVGRALSGGASEAGSASIDIEKFRKTETLYPKIATEETLEPRKFKQEDFSSQEVSRDFLEETPFLPRHDFGSGNADLGRAAVRPMGFGQSVRYPPTGPILGLRLEEPSIPYKVTSYKEEDYIEDEFEEEIKETLEGEGGKKLEEQRRELPQQEQEAGILGVPIGQIHATYILSIAPEGDLILVDQHAAHERLTHEYLRQNIEKGRLMGQVLLIPEPIEMPLREAELILQAQEELNYLGIELESFGHGSLLLRSIPAIFHKGDYRALLKDIAEELLEDPDRSVRETDAFDRRIEGIMARLACHGSIRAGRILKHEEMNRLLRDMEHYPRAQTCPHGRPTWLRLNKLALEKLFGRVK